MKKLSIVLILLFFVATSLKADPPKKIVITPGEDGKWIVVAQHPVKDVSSHYIDLITITVNKQEVKTIKFQKQSDANAQTVEVVLPQAIKGSMVKVKARCNEFGSKTATIKI
jgi:desulfoferrodoxin (superoxide reductase-like protein)